MGLIQYKTAKTSIPLPAITVEVDGEIVEQENSFSVRGLGLEDFSVLLTNHLSAITQAAESYAAYQSNTASVASLQGFVLVVLREYPGLMAEVISVAADEPEAKDIRLPMQVQIAALTEIARLTLTDAGGLGNLLAMLGSVLRGVGGDSLPPSLAQVLSRASIGGFEKKSTS